MAFDNPPFVMDGTMLDAEVIRRALATLIGSAGGIVNPGDLTVTQNGTPNMSVLIGTGQIWVPGTSTSSQGPYYSENKASITQTISASNPSNPRVDTITAQVQDAAYAGVAKQFGAGYVIGTPTAGATLSNLNGKGTVPASSYVLAYVLVPASASSIVTADISNVASRVVLGGDLPPVPVSASITAAAGSCSIVTGGAAPTITLPSPVAGATVQVANPGDGIATLSAGSALIFAAGPAAIGATSGGAPTTSIQVAPYGGYVSVIADGTYWYVVAGQTDSGWVALGFGGTVCSDGGGAGGFHAAYQRKGNTVRMRGLIENTSGSTQSAGATLATSFPSPASDSSFYVANISAGAPSGVEVSSSGLTLLTGTFGNGQNLDLGQIIYDLV